MRDWEATYMQQQLALSSFGYSREDLQAITDFLTHLQACNVKERRLCKYIGHFSKLVKLTTKPLVSLQNNELDLLLSRINNNKGWSEWTRHDYLHCLRRFYRWLDNNDSRAGRIKVLAVSLPVLDEREVLTLSEVERMQNVTRNIQSKALLRCLFETGARAGEFLGLAVGDVTDEPPVIVFHLKGTKNQYAKRSVPVNNPDAISLFKEYLAGHPNKSDKTAALWLTFNGLPMEPRNLAKFLWALAKKAGIHKAVNPHAFRHAKVTQLRAAGVPDACLEQFFGWTKGSRMLRVYDKTGYETMKNALLSKTPSILPQDQQDRVNDELAYAILNDKELMRNIVRSLHAQGKLELLQAWENQRPYGDNNFMTTPGQGFEKKLMSPQKPSKKSRAQAIKQG